MNACPLVSVVMPVFNAQEYLKEAIESILTQTYSDFEFIIVNDGSMDLSCHIIKEYMAVDNRIYLVDRENRGLSYSLNEAISLSRGKYIARMDADDISLPNRLEKQVKFMEENDEIGICGSRIRIFGDRLKESIWNLPLSDEECKATLFIGSCFAHPSVIIRKEVLSKNNIKYGMNLAEDYCLWVDLSRQTKFANVKEVLLLYRQTKTSMSSKAKNNLLNLYNDMQGHINKLLSTVGINDNESSMAIFAIIVNANFSLIKILRTISLIISQNKKNNVYSGYLLRKFFIKKFWIYTKNKICGRLS